MRPTDKPHFAAERNPRPKLRKHVGHYDPLNERLRKKIFPQVRRVQPPPQNRPHHKGTPHFRVLLRRQPNRPPLPPLLKPHPVNPLCPVGTLPPSPLRFLPLLIPQKTRLQNQPVHLLPPQKRRLHKLLRRVRKPRGLFLVQQHRHGGHVLNAQLAPQKNHPYLRLVAVQNQLAHMPPKFPPLYPYLVLLKKRTPFPQQFLHKQNHRVVNRVKLPPPHGHKRHKVVVFAVHHLHNRVLNQREPNRKKPLCVALQPNGLKRRAPLVGHRVGWLVRPLARVPPYPLERLIKLLLLPLKVPPPKVRRITRRRYTRSTKVRRKPLFRRTFATLVAVGLHPRSHSFDASSRRVSKSHPADARSRCAFRTNLRASRSRRSGTARFVTRCATIIASVQSPSPPSNSPSQSPLRRPHSRPPPHKRVRRYSLRG